MDIRTERIRLRIPQYRLTAMAGLSRFKLWLHERGEGSLTDEEQKRLHEALAKEAVRLRDSASALVERSVPVSALED